MEGHNGSFLKYMDRKAWKVVLKGREYPVVKDKDGKESIKPEKDWDENDDK